MCLLTTDLKSNNTVSSQCDFFFSDSNIGLQLKPPEHGAAVRGCHTEEQQQDRFKTNRSVEACGFDDPGVKWQRFGAVWNFGMQAPIYNETWTFKAFKNEWKPLEFQCLYCLKANRGTITL